MNVVLFQIYNKIIVNYCVNIQSFFKLRIRAIDKIKIFWQIHLSHSSVYVYNLWNVYFAIVFKKSAIRTLNEYLKMEINNFDAMNFCLLKNIYFSFSFNLSFCCVATNTKK